MVSRIAAWIRGDHLPSPCDSYAIVSKPPLVPLPIPAEPFKSEPDPVVEEVDRLIRRLGRMHARMMGGSKPAVASAPKAGDELAVLLDENARMRALLHEADGSLSWMLSRDRSHWDESEIRRVIGAIRTVAS